MQKQLLCFASDPLVIICFTKLVGTYKWYIHYIVVLKFSDVCLCRIAGWNQTTRPFLQTAFHVGDQLVSVNGQVVESAKVAYKLIKQCSEYDKISLIIKRLPKARIFSFKRSRPGEDLGIVRERETGKVRYIDTGVRVRNLK